MLDATLLFVICITLQPNRKILPYIIPLTVVGMFFIYNLPLNKEYVALFHILEQDERSVVFNSIKVNSTRHYEPQSPVGTSTVSIASLFLGNMSL